MSAFLNHTLTYDLNYSNEQTKVLLKLTKNLYNFGGVADRERFVDKKFGFKKQHPSELGGFNANLISSWIIKLLKEKLQLDQDYRSFERAFFMLGFDLKQIKD